MSERSTYLFVLDVVVWSRDVSGVHSVKVVIRLARTRARVVRVEGQLKQFVSFVGVFSEMSFPAFWRDCMKKC